jgi:unsaturated chondroitin disaccharide hydrolase
MYRRIICAVVILISLSGTCNAQVLFSEVISTLNYAEQKLKESVVDISISSRHPRQNYEGEDWKKNGRTDWTSGFWSGCLWQMYDWERSNDWFDNAKKWTSDLESNKFDISNHDIGFQIMCSFGNGNRSVSSDNYKAVIIQAAKSLSKRFNEKIGSIISWDKASWHPFNKPVIVDNLMNLELLFYATELSGDSTYYKMAVQHVTKTLETHQRTDGTFYHIVDYDDDGNVIFKGFNMNSSLGSEETWARGQAWALYGLTFCYKYSKDIKFLNAAEKLTEYLKINLPDDHIPYFVFNYSLSKNSNKDVSAGAIMFSAFIELYSTTHKTEYLTLAEDILTGLISDQYLTKNKSYYSILYRATENYSDTEKGLIYADYYFLEGLLRYLKLDTEVPSSPTGVKYSSISDQNCSLSWNASTDNTKIREYNIYKDGIFYKSVSGTSIYVSDLSPGFTYSFNITAIDFAGNESASGNSLSVTTLLTNEISILSNKPVLFYPNPAFNRLNFQLKELSTVSIFNAIGNKVLYGKIDKGANNMPLNLKSGLYYINISSANAGEYFDKLIVR